MPERISIVNPFFTPVLTGGAVKEFVYTRISICLLYTSKSIHSSLKIEANSLSLGQVRDVINGRLVLGEHHRHIAGKTQQRLRDRLCTDAWFQGILPIPEVVIFIACHECFFVL